MTVPSEPVPQPPPAFDPQRPTPDLLLCAYAQAAFPMVDDRRGAIEWFSPDPRGVIPLDGFRVPASLVRVVRSGRFDVCADRAFETVMRACGAPRRRDDAGTWIDERLISAYVGLFERGHAHSVEARLGGRLVGGLYGVHIGGAFFGESMFVRPDLGGTDASKVCLVHLVEHLRARGFTLLDTQFWNEHLDRFGCVEIPRAAYCRALEKAVAAPVTWGVLDPGPAPRGGRDVAGDA